jgi:hypothetical protein
VIIRIFIFLTKKVKKNSTTKLVRLSNKLIKKGMEKLNDISTSEYFRGSNRKEFVKQILYRRFRLAYQANDFKGTVYF